ncbi:MAG: hypothetical protein KDF59_10080 [Nitrosomonas sp.]|nr:hypothetical protein [Nitrosomonas sp.]
MRRNKESLGRKFYMSKPDDEELGPLSLLPGKWVSKGGGWNMIALPFDGGPFDYRLLMNQYDETLEFTMVDDNVPNRGLPGVIDNSGEDDQFVVTLDYQQSISQQIADDFPKSGLAGTPGLAIHHEPGLWLHMKNLRTIDKDFSATKGVVDAELTVARLASIPHGNSVLALGTSSVEKGMPEIPPLSGLPIGRFEDLSTPGYDFEDDLYLEPYKHFIHNPFMGNVGVPGFPGFNPRDMNEILRFANKGVDIHRTTVLTVDTTRQNAGIHNIPFVVRQADATSMKSTFWIQELKEKGKHGHCRHRKLRMQYSQVVILDFFRPREDGQPGRARWPHISINTLEKVD